LDSHTAFCPNPDCPASGQVSKGNIYIHSRKQQRYRCTACGKTFAATKGTPFYRLRSATELVVTVVTLLAYGCPVQAIVAAFGLDARTVADWQQRAAAQSQRVQEHLVEQPRDLGEVQMDELRVKRQGQIVWVALAIATRTRLWLGGEVSPHRDRTLLRALAGRVRRCAQTRPLLLVTDGLAAYVAAIRRVFRDKVARGRRGRPRLEPWRGLCIAQVIKRYQQRRVVAVEQRIKQGRGALVERLRYRAGGTGVLNTAYIERLNGTFRQRLTPLVRRSRALARRTGTIVEGMWLVGAVYNFCTPHTSLRLRCVGGHKERTPAMVASITAHCWGVKELLSYRVPPPRWVPPKRRGRMSAAMKLKIIQWCT
jgi:transposase-like protein